MGKYNKKRKGTLYFKEDEDIILNYNDLENSTIATKIISNITLVSAYFRIKSKHKISNYYKWLDIFFQINQSMVFFVDDIYYQEIILKRPKEYRNKTIWIKTNLTDFYSFKHYLKEFNESFKVDIESSYHTVPLYLIWSEKINFLKIGASKNFFKSKCFYWIDAGSFRNYDDSKKYFNDWPSAEKCFEDGRVYINEVEEYSQHFKEKLKEFDIEAHKQFQTTCNVDASFFGGQKEYINKFRDLYYETLNLYLQHGIFIGKDQNIFAYIAYFHEDIIKRVYLKEFYILRNYLSKDNNIK